MASNPVVNSLTFTGSVAGQASIQAQGIAGGLTFLLPNLVPNPGQLLDVQAVNGNNVVLGWTSPQSTSIDLSQITRSGALSGEVVQWNGTNWVPSAFVPGSGTVTSVSAGNIDSVFTTNVATPTSTPAITFTANTQSANTVYAGPVTGIAAAPTFRALVANDIPALPYDASGAAAAVAAQLPATHAPVTSNFLTGYTAGTPGTFSAAQPAFTDLSGSLAISMINSKVGNGNAVQITNTGQTIVAGDVVTYDATGNTQDSGTLLSALALSANLPSSAGPTANNFVTAYNSGTHSFTLAQPSAANLSNGTTGTGAVVLANAPTFTANPVFASAQGNGSKVQLSTGTTTTGHAVTYDSNGNTVDSGFYGTTLQGNGANGQPAASDNHIATGNNATFTGGTSGTTGITITLSGNAAYSAANAYSVMVTPISTPVGVLWASTTDGTHFTVFSTAPAETAAFFWVCFGKTASD